MGQNEALGHNVWGLEGGGDNFEWSRLENSIDKSKCLNTFRENLAERNLEIWIKYLNEFCFDLSPNWELLITRNWLGQVIAARRSSESANYGEIGPGTTIGDQKEGFYWKESVKGAILSLNREVLMVLNGPYCERSSHYGEILSSLISKPVRN